MFHKHVNRINIAAAAVKAVDCDSRLSATSAHAPEGARVAWMNEDPTPPAGEVLRQAMLDALGEIEARLAENPITPADVHLARRAAKRARALARLAPPALAALATHTRKTVDRARRALGRARDADVRAATLVALKPKLGSAHDALLRLAQGGAQDAAPAANIETLRAEIDALMRDWRLCEAPHGIDDIVAAAATAYRRMRKRAKAARNGESAALHRWRTAVVDFEYVADFLSRFAPVMKQAKRDADRLRGDLGDINDLDELCGHVARSAVAAEDGEAVHRLRKASAARRARLVERALARAGRLLEDKPSQWVRKVRRSCAR